MGILPSPIIHQRTFIVCQHYSSCSVQRPLPDMYSPWSILHHLWCLQIHSRATIPYFLLSSIDSLLCILSPLPVVHCPPAIPDHLIRVTCYVLSAVRHPLSVLPCFFALAPRPSTEFTLPSIYPAPLTNALFCAGEDPFCSAPARPITLARAKRGMSRCSGKASRGPCSRSQGFCFGSQVLSSRSPRHLFS